MSIKIVYNWIGPRGPIINTDLPNLLTFAGVTPDIQVNSVNYWAEFVWGALFNNRDGYEMYPAVAIKDKDIFIYPFTMSWRVDFNVHFIDHNGILEFSQVGGDLVHHVRVNNGYFLFDLSAEAHVTDSHLKLLHSYFERLRIPRSKIIYLTGCANPDVVYESFCRRHNVPNDSEHRIKLINFPCSQLTIARELGDGTNNGTFTEPRYDENIVPEKLFLSWNRRLRSHRGYLALSLYKAGLLPRCHMAMLECSPEGPEIFGDSLRDHELNYLGIDREDVASFAKLLPLVLDGEKEIRYMCGDFTGATRNYYSTSLVSLITETNYNENELTLTEKSFKPFQEKHPFISIAGPGLLESLHEMGYKTFNDFWSEAYDTIQDPISRMKEIVRVCKEIAAWDNNKILEFRRQVKPILEDNFRQVKVNMAPLIVNKITNHVKSNLLNI